MALAGIFLAIFIPLWIEYTKRPRLRVELADDANRTEIPPAFRIVHIQVVNEPLTGWPSRWLLRNAATGCHVQISIRSKSDGTSLPTFRGKWSARPEPIQFLPSGGSVKAFFDPQKQPATFSYDLSAGPDGEAVAVAIKHEGDREAYAFAPGIYHNVHKALKHPEAALPHTEYEVEVVARAGEISGEAKFLLTNEGHEYTGLSLVSAA